MEPRMTPLVRSYSLQLKADESADILSQSLAFAAAEEQKEIEKRDSSEREWITWLRCEESSSDEDHERLSNRCKEAVKHWKELCRHSHNGSDVEVFTIPTVEKLIAATNKMISDRKSHHESGLHVAKQSFLDFVNVMSDYCYIFSVFPRGDKYTSVITGVLSTIAKTAANHKRTTGMLSTGLDDITDSLRLVTKYREMVRTADAQRHYIDIYLSIFEFLCIAMSWYGSGRKRLLSALNKNFNDNDVNPKIDAVKKAVERLLRETQYDTAVVVRKTASQLDNMSDKIAGDVCDRVADQIDKLKVGVYAGEHLCSVQEHFKHEKEHGPALLGLDSDRVMSSQLTRTTSAVEAPVTVETEPLAAVDRLAPFIENAQDSLMNEYGSLMELALPEEVVTQMQDWMRDLTSRMLWVEGVEVYSGPLLSMAALYIHSTIEATGVPCISHFCRYPFRSHSDLSSGEALFISLLYSIIAQLSDVLVVDFSTSANRELRNCLNQLDGRMESSRFALRLIQELVPQLPYMTVWIMDDIHLTETTSTLPYLENLIEILRNKNGAEVVKVLFTTQGNSRLLCSNLQVTERVDASRMAQERGGHRLSGGASFY